MTREKLERKLFESRVVLINGYVNGNNAAGVVFDLLQLNALDSEQEIQLFIGSYGGNYLDMLSIYVTNQHISNPVVGVGIGAVNNYAALILAACNKRSCLKHCSFSLEQPYGTLQPGSNQQTEIAIAAKEVTLERQVMEQLFAKHTGQSVEKIHNDIEFGLELDAAQAKEYGIVDSIIA